MNAMQEVYKSSVNPNDFNHVGPQRKYSLQNHFTQVSNMFSRVLLLAHLSRMFTGELIGQAGIRRPFTISKKNIHISEASGQS